MPTAEVSVRRPPAQKQRLQPMTLTAALTELVQALTELVKVGTQRLKDTPKE